MDLEIKLLRKKIIEELNQSELPLEVKRLMLLEILSEVKQASDKEVQKQIEIYNQEIDKKKESEEE